MYFTIFIYIFTPKITRTQDRAVDKAQNLGSRGQWFESQSGQVKTINFGFTFAIKRVDFYKTIAIWFINKP